MVTFLTILSWPIAGQAQACAFGKAACYTKKTLRNPAVAAAVCVSLQNQQRRRMEDIQRQATLNASHITQSQTATHQVHSAVFTPSKVTAFNPTKPPVTVPVMPSLRRDTIPVRTPLDSTETIRKVDGMKEGHDRKRIIGYAPPPDPKRGVLNQLNL